jgi:alpha-beta hydrolase superfamily lysophospholipase
MDFSIFRIIAVSLLFVSTLASSGCSSLLYAPTRVWHVHPERLGYTYDTVSLDSDARIKGWWFKQSRFPEPKGFLIFFHGNGENRSSHFLSLGWMLNEGYDYFIFDYQGYGDSEGQPSPAGTVQDGMSALRWFFAKAGETRYRGVPLFVFAQSLGGPVALRSLAELNEKREIPPGLRAVILDSSFTSYTSAGASVLSQSWVTTLFQPLSWVLLSDRWAPGPKWNQLPRVKYLVLHGDRDQLIRPKLGRELYDALPEPKDWISIEGGRHIESLFVGGGKYRKIFMGRIEK